MTLKSMTGYGEGKAASAGAQCSCVIQSVNRKFLDCKVSLPSELTFFETDVRKEIAKRVQRGSLKVYFEVLYDSEESVAIRPNLGLARKIKGAYEELAKELGYEKGVSLERILSHPGVLGESKQLPNDSKLKEPLFDALRRALENLDRSKIVEGEALQAHLLEQLGAMGGSIAVIEGSLDGVIERYREKLTKRLEEYKSEESHELVMREVALLAERADIEEEITRFKSHIERAEKVLKDGSSPLGKAVEFLIQEMLREVNTMASKSHGIEAKEAAVTIKMHLEQMREQIQNVE